MARERDRDHRAAIDKLRRPVAVDARACVRRAAGHDAAREVSPPRSARGVNAQFGWGGGDQLPLVAGTATGPTRRDCFLGATSEFTVTNFYASSGVAADFGWPHGSYTVAGAT